MAKMCKKSVGVVFTVLCGFSVSAFAQMRETLRDAGAFVEPAVTYEMSDSTISNSVIGSSSGEVSGYGVALRLGGHVSDAVFLALDGRYSFPNVADNRTGLDADGRAYNWGPTLGVQMPNVGVRLWAGYVADAEIDPQGNNADVKFANGDGFRVGAGFKVYNVSLNLEYADLTYDDSILERVGSFVPGANFQSVDYENKSYTASVSFPFAL